MSAISRFFYAYSALLAFSGVIQAVELPLPLSNSGGNATESSRFGASAEYQFVKQNPKFKASAVRAFQQAQGKPVFLLLRLNPTAEINGKNVAEQELKLILERYQLPIILVFYTGRGQVVVSGNAQAFRKLVRLKEAWEIKIIEAFDERIPPEAMRYMGKSLAQAVFAPVESMKYQLVKVIGRFKKFKTSLSQTSKSARKQRKENKMFSRGNKILKKLDQLRDKEIEIRFERTSGLFSFELPYYKLQEIRDFFDLDVVEYSSMTTGAQPLRLQECKKALGPLLE